MRAVVFAHYDKDNLVDDYVVYYLKALRKIADTLVFVSCCELPEEEKSKTGADIIITEPHKEYDFGSYKRGFFALNPGDYAEIVFVNDSVYGPFKPLEPIFEKMSGADFWGITQNVYGFGQRRDFFSRIFVKSPHVQSYFLGFKKNVFTSKCFVDFMKSIKEEENKVLVIINYEIGLSKTLMANGFRHGVYIRKYKNSGNTVAIKWRQLISNYGMPFMKCSLARLMNRECTTVEGYEDVIRKVSDYPVELIENNVKRTAVTQKNPNSAPKWVKLIVFDLLASIPVCRRQASLMVKELFPNLFD